MRKMYLKQGKQFPDYKRLLRILYVAFFCFLLSANFMWGERSYAQRTLLTLSLNNVELEEVFNSIRSQSEFEFFYSNDQVDVSVKTSIHIENADIYEVLKQILPATYEFEINDRYVLISKAKVNTPTAVSASQQQGRTITGVVRDVSGPVIGANVIVKGTTNGAVTNIDGQFTISNVPANAVLQVSFIGYISQEVNVGTQTQFDIMLIEDVGTLDEVVVVGYGVQARRDISGSITTVSADNLKEIPVTTFAEALMGQAAGVNISSTGAPGSPTTIRVRGVGSVNTGAAGPLVIVDGISNVSIDAINPNDIENFSILKDASATAIYGARGANGVILITTKQGSKEGSARVTYDGYFGISTMANNGYDVLNGWEDMEFVAQGMINKRDILGLEPGSHSQFGELDTNDKLTMPYATKPAGYSRQQIIDQWGSVDNWVASYQPNGANSWAKSAYYDMLDRGYSEEEARKGTDWYNLVVKKGIIQNHNLSLLGGNGEKGMYSISFGVSLQEGTFKSSFMNRYTLRVNIVHNPTKYLSIGANLNLMASENGGDRGDISYGSVHAQTYGVKSWVPVYAVDGVNFAGSQSSEGGRASTPVATAYSQSLNTSRQYRGQTSVFAEVKPIPGLTIKTQFAPSLNGAWSTNFSPVTIMYNKEGTGNNSYSETASHSMTWQWTNTVNYSTYFNVDHKVDMTVGTEAINENVIGRTMSASRIDYAFENDPNTWTLSNGSSANLSNSGSMSTHTGLFGYFGRAEYSYKGTYIVNGSIRRDASSRFSEKNRWGTFPSISVAWRVSDMAFMQSTKSFIDDLKFRAGFGTTGNSNTGNENAYNWAFQYGTGNTHLYDREGVNTSVWTGYGVTALGDASAKWETVRTINLGIDVTAFNQRLTTSVEWFTRQTTDMLVQANWSALAGAGNITLPRVNIGDMSNKGVDITVGWSDRTRLFRYNLSANISTYRNKVIRMGSADIFTSSRLNNVSVTTEGQPVGMFYGYKVLGVYKSVDDVLNYQTNGQTVLPYAAPSRGTYDPQNWVGRYIIEDVNGDGQITAEDRTIIGNPHPDFTGGLNASIMYRDFDLSTQFYFSVGNEIFKNYMYHTHYGAEQSTYSKDRRDNSWHPVNNPDGIYPLWVTANNEGAEAGTVSNSIYVDDGSYLRMRTLSMGYTLPRNILRSTGLERVRIYVQISNVFTLTKYPGLDPEVRSSNELNRGVDSGAYGMPRQYVLGVNISF